MRKDSTSATWMRTKPGSLPWRIIQILMLLLAQGPRAAAVTIDTAFLSVELPKKYSIFTVCGRCGVYLQLAKDSLQCKALHAGAAEADVQLSKCADLAAQTFPPTLERCQRCSGVRRQSCQPCRLPFVRVALGCGSRRRCL